MELSLEDDILISTVSDTFGLVELYTDVGATALFGQHDVPDVAFFGCFSSDHPITSGFNQKMDLLLARSVTLAPERPEGVAGAEILRTLPYTWAEKRFQALWQPNAPRPKQDPR